MTITSNKFSFFTSSEDVAVVNDLEANGVTSVAGDADSSVRIYFSDGSYAGKV